MAVVLGARTEVLLDNLLRSLGANVLRTAAPPNTATVTGVLKANIVAATTSCQVSNGHLWPSTGEITVLDGSDTETRAYRRVYTRHGNKAPSYNGQGDPPDAFIELVGGATFANNHTAPKPVYMPPQYQLQSSGMFDMGLIGTQDFVALLKALKPAFAHTAATLTATGYNADRVYSYDDSTTTFAEETTDAASAGASDWTIFPAAEEDELDYAAIGHAYPFTSLVVTLGTGGDATGVVAWEYYNGTTWVAIPGVTDGTTSLQASGTVTWALPTDWAKVSLNATAALYYVRARITTVYGVTNPVGSRVRLESPYIVADDTAFTANRLVGDTVTIVSVAADAAPEGESSTVIANTANYLAVDPPFTAQVSATNTYRLETTNFDSYIETLEAYLPAKFDSNSNRVSDASQARTPGADATLILSAVVKVINQYGGTVPDAATLGLLSHEVDRTTRLTKAAAAGDTVLYLEDASKLNGVTNIIVGVTTATILRNNAKPGGQGPNTVVLTAVLGGAGEAAWVTVGPSPRGTVATGRLHKAPAPFPYGQSFVQYLNAMLAAIEAYTIPA